MISSNSDKCACKSAFFKHKIQKVDQPSIPHVAIYLYQRREENQLDATECFIAIIICSTCFGHSYAHHQELETILLLLPHMVCTALVAGGRLLGVEQQAMRPAIIICSTCFGHLYAIIRSSRLYLCYSRIWFVMPWLLVIGC